MSEHADYCPVHGIPMWWWPTGGTWACQRTTCEATMPVRWEETQAAQRIDHALDALRYATRAMWPGVLATPPRSRIFVTGIS